MKIISTLKNALRGLLCLSVCGICGEPSESGELCGRCMSRYTEECAVLCKVCGKTASECMCGDSFFKHTRTMINGMEHISLTFYMGSGSGRITEKMILNLKSDGSYSKLFAKELADKISETFTADGCSLDGWAVTYVPRSSGNFMKYGIDQGEEVAIRLAKLLKIPFRQTFTRTESTEQKSLNAAGRLENAESSIVPRRNAITKGDKLLLFDDIITTGATITTTARHLYFCGADAVFPVSIARTYNHTSEIHQ